MKVKLLLIVSVVCVVTSCSSAQHNDKDGVGLRQIGYIEQEMSGALTIVTLSKSKDGAEVVVMDFGKSSGKKQKPISVHEFEKLWNLMHSANLAQYKFTPSKTDSMAEPEFYTIRLLIDGKGDSLRLPRKNDNDNIKKPVSMIQGYIN